MNIRVSEQLISQLVYEHGVNTFCLCPGGRNAPLVSVLSKAKGIQVLSFFDERSAGFFALGLARKEGRPVAVLTTSGTAVAELLPSVIEAYYSHTPLVLITADRPSAYRGTGASQSIEQKNLFGPYVGQQWDLENTVDFSISKWSGFVPCYINVCFDEPLLDKPAPVLDFRNQVSHCSSPTKKKKNTQKAWPNNVLGPTGFSVFNSQKEVKKIKAFFEKCQNPLCLLAEMPESIKKEVEDRVSFFHWPVYAEALSHLRGSQKLFILKSGEGILKWLVLNQKIDGVIRIGRRPVARFWQDLEKKYAHLPVLSISDQSYAGLSRIEPALSFNTFFDWAKNNTKTTHKLLFAKSAQHTIAKKDKALYEHLIKTVNQHPLSEPALIRKFSQSIPKRSLLFLGNSLPIREWNQVAPFLPNKNIKYLGNRGANGIDGLISTFLGACELDKQNWCLVGDLSALYDLSSLWAFHQLKKKPTVFILVVNNSGGRIFESLFSSPAFINAHHISFQHWAKMWGFYYYKLKEWPNKPSFLSPAIIEGQVDPKYTKKFNSFLENTL